MSLAGSHLEVDLASYALAHDPDVASKWKGGVIRREGMYDKTNVVLFDHVNDLNDEQLLHR